MKMSMIKRIFALLLTVAMLICALAACGQPNTSISADRTPLHATANAKNESTATQKQITSVNITCGKSAIESFAAAELKWYFAKKNVALADDGYGVEVKLDASIPEGGYKISADENGLVIAGGNERGVLYGVYKFLEEFGGVGFYTHTLEVVPTTDLVLKEGVILEFTPYFEMRRLSWNGAGTSSDWCLKNGVNAHDGVNDAIYGGKVVYGSGLFVHTLGALTETGGGASVNPCLSLDSPEGQANFQKVITKLRAALEADPTINIVSVSQNDNNYYCLCDYC